MTRSAPAPADPALPGLRRLADPDALGALVQDAGWSATGPVAARLRWKPGTNARLGALVPTAAGTVALLAATFPAGSPKAARLADACPHAVTVDDVVVVQARADPALAAAPGIPLSYNPGRRWVGRVGAAVVKVHAVAPPRGVDALLTRPPARLAPFLPRAVVSEGGRRAHLRWVAGRSPVGPADTAAVATAVAALHACPPPPGLPVLDGRAALAAAARAVGGLAALVPGEGPRAVGLLGVLRAALARWPRDRVLVHGDLSPDQAVVTGDGAVLLDLDRAAVGPAGWDVAQWALAPLAAGTPTPPALGVADPVLVLAAALCRAPEPARRLHPGRLAATGAVLDVAEDAAEELR